MPCWLGRLPEARYLEYRKQTKVLSVYKARESDGYNPEECRRCLRVRGPGDWALLRRMAVSIAAESGCVRGMRGPPRTEIEIRSTAAPILETAARKGATLARVILSGGPSSRMGSPKALLPTMAGHSSTLLEVTAPGNWSAPRRARAHAEPSRKPGT